MHSPRPGPEPPRWLVRILPVRPTTTGLHGKNQYKADGLIKLYGFKKLEVLLLETSGSLENNDKVKINFDHHKAIFGALAMLKTTADEFRFASVKTFQHLKLYFVHAAGK